MAAGLVFPFVKSSLARVGVSQVGSGAWLCSVITFVINYLRERPAGTQLSDHCRTWMYILKSTLTMVRAQADLGNALPLPVKLALQRQKLSALLVTVLSAGHLLNVEYVVVSAGSRMSSERVGVAAGTE